MKSKLYVGVAILTGVQCHQKCLFGYISLIQSRLIKLGLGDMQCLSKFNNWSHSQQQTVLPPY